MFGAFIAGSLAFGVALSVMQNPTAWVVFGFIVLFVTLAEHG
jgi:hypothetical protein